MNQNNIQSDTEFQQRINELASESQLLRDYVNQTLPTLAGPSISHFSPLEGDPGCAVEIFGSLFSPVWHENIVRVGGQRAVVTEASPDRLRVITSRKIGSSPMQVVVAGKTAESEMNLTVLPEPLPEAERNGPPVRFTGIGPMPLLAVTGNKRVLLVLCYAQDLVPTNLPQARTDVQNRYLPAWDYYKQASFGKLQVLPDYTDWVQLGGNNADYMDTTIQNVRVNMLPRLWAECAQGAVNQGMNLDNYDAMAAVIFLNGQFIRAWGGFSQLNFQTQFTDVSGNTVNINLTASHALDLIAIQESADWGRLAHEYGHTVVEGGLVLGEDIYQADLIDPAVATAEDFDLMGNHDNHPLFSAHFLHQLGWITPSNVRELTWDRNPFRQEFDLVAHDLNENTDPNRAHIIRIKVTDGLYYYVEVRQQPDSTAANRPLFDANIPIQMAANRGGVVVSKVITGQLNMNQEMRLVTLLHPARVLTSGMVATDPARGLIITVVNDNVQNRPLVCRVRVEWAQTTADDPAGSFDLQVLTWDQNYQTDDIWVDRLPYGTYDNMDAAGNPVGNGDRPKVNEKNHFWGRVRNQGVAAAQNVRLTFYSVTPPGIGDNGNWAPIATKVIPTIPAGGQATDFVNWVPTVGQHTCLKIYAEQQLGEVTGSNNQAQENIFNFDASGGSPVQPVTMQTAVRNPLRERSIILLQVRGVPAGYEIQMDHSWVWLDPLGEQPINLTVIPTEPLQWYQEQRKYGTAPVRVSGWVPRQYNQVLPVTGYPASRFLPIGGIGVNVTPKRKVKVTIHTHGEPVEDAAIVGEMTPAVPGQPIRVKVWGAGGFERVVETSTSSNGQFTAHFQLPKGKYLSVADVIYAPDVVKTESNRIIVQVGRP